MKVFLRPNFLRRQAIQGVEKIARQLRVFGLIPLVSSEDAIRLPSVEDCVVLPHEIQLASCDIVMPIGGDGTVLHESLMALQACKPVLGVNAGRLGFLNQLELSELSSLSRLRDGSFSLSKRMLLECEVARMNGSHIYTVINDIVVSRPETNQILDISVYDNHGSRLLIRQRADGVIFATPTGSTAYSYSAGGPIVSPEMNAILLTGIAPHTPFRSGMVLPTGTDYQVKEVHSHEHTGFTVSADGTLVETVDAREKVTITVRKSKQTLEFVDLGLRDFYNNLNEKIVSM